MVSKSVTRLEQRLGVRLLNRTTRRISLTEAGTELYRKSAMAIAQLDIGRYQTEPRGTLRLSAPTSFTLLHLRQRLARFLERYPHVTLELALEDRVVDIVEDGYDAALRIGVLSDSSLIARRLAPSRMLLCAAPAYLAARGEPEHPDDLAGHNFLRYAYMSVPEIPMTGPNGESASLGFAGNLVCNNGDALLAAALTGQGIVVLPTFYVGQHLAEGALRVVLPHWALPELTIYAVYPVNRHLAAKVRLFVDFLAERYDSKRHSAWGSTTLSPTRKASAS